MPDKTERAHARGGMCAKCRDTFAWGHSPLCLHCLAEVQLVVDREGKVVDERTALHAGPGRVFAARYRYRAINCGPRCGSCPHTWYVLRVWRAGGLAREKYIGPAAGERGPYEKPALRQRRRPFGHG